MPTSAPPSCWVRARLPAGPDQSASATLSGRPIRHMGSRSRANRTAGRNQGIACPARDGRARAPHAQRRPQRRACLDWTTWKAPGSGRGSARLVGRVCGACQNPPFWVSFTPSCTVAGPEKRLMLRHPPSSRPANPFLENPGRQVPPGATVSPQGSNRTGHWVVLNPPLHCGGLVY